ncbi:hypothetical protein QYE76_062443 [Lolium multiflorum]|uniref:Uncharacterized protein n=1 Tax=Lolium multiflorum TaxID=4521 RepID=A0AAD8S4H3_LOLMU|nr:hypothetical protein QYE76_062443 [Lolium multiflorum]
MLLGAIKPEKDGKKLPAYGDPPPPPLPPAGNSRKSPAAWTVPGLLQADSSAKRLLAAAALYRVRRRLQPGVVCTELAASGPSTSSRPTSFSKSEHAFYSRAPARSSTALSPAFVMSSFAGLSVVTNGKHCTTTAIDAGMGSGYHLLVVKDYLRTVQEVPNGKGICSGHFMVGGHKWCISYHPNGERPSCADFISLGLCLVTRAVKAKFVFSFVDQVEKQKAKEIFAIKSCSFSVKGCFWGPFKFMKRDALEQSAHLKADCFTIRIDIMVCNDLTTQQDVVGTLSGIGQHFKILLQDKVGCDVTFEVSGETFLAHRCVLAARSKVFRAQFFGPMAQGITSSAIQIKDMDAKVFAAMLSFIYSDSFPQMEENKAQAVQGQEEEAAKLVTWLQDLLVASDRYDIQQLKFLCEKKLFNLIGVSSVACTLALAERHNCHGLKDACLTFIQVQSPKCLEMVMETDGWELIVTTYPSILKEIIAKVASNQKDNKRKYESM